jgi:hypothetical protein
MFSSEQLLEGAARARAAGNELNAQELEIASIQVGQEEQALLSAGPVNGNLVSDLGWGKNDLRQTDTPSGNMTIGAINPPEGMTASDYFKSLIAADKEYADNVEYPFFAGLLGGRNSNSYVAGLVAQTRGTTDVNFDDFVGGDDPLIEENDQD